MDFLEVAHLLPLRPVLAVSFALLALASQFVPAARFPMHASMFFAILATLGWRQGWPSTLTNVPGSGASPVLGFAWLVEASLAALFLVIALTLTLGRGRGAAVSLLLSLPILLTGAGARLGWWPDALPWPDAPWPSLALPGTVFLGGGLLLFLGATGCFALQDPVSTPWSASPPEAPTPAPRIILGMGHAPDDDPGWTGEDADPHHTQQAVASLGPSWSPLRKRSLKRHRHRRAARNSR
ncbi:MAG: hypothetical protein KGS60_01855 [Verrucomicrobia bacterium]|nr:hypothetical protein [Verrucomicrobiota bacterium]